VLGPLRCRALAGARSCPSGFWAVVGEDGPLGSCELADAFGHRGADLVLDLGRALDVASPLSPLAVLR
jgi:hypothetical protein